MTTAPEARAALLLRTVALMRERVEHIARLITLEQGKTKVFFELFNLVAYR